MTIESGFSGRKGEDSLKAAREAVIWQPWFMVRDTQELYMPAKGSSESSSVSQGQHCPKNVFLSRVTREGLSFHESTSH